MNEVKIKAKKIKPKPELKERLRLDYIAIRKRTEEICAPLKTEDYVVQPIIDVSPPKWHLGHSTWFFETFLLKQFLKNYKEFNPDYNYVFTCGENIFLFETGAGNAPVLLG